MTEIIISKKRQRDKKVNELVENLKTIKTKGEFSVNEIAGLLGIPYQLVSVISRKGTEVKMSYKKADELNKRAIEIINKI